MNLRLCYRVEKEAGWGQDEHGDPTEVYSCVKINSNTYNVQKDKYKDLVDLGKTMTSKMFNIEEELVTPITLNEYLDNTEEED